MKEIVLLKKGALNADSIIAFCNEYRKLLFEASKITAKGGAPPPALIERIETVLKKGELSNEFVGFYECARSLEDSLLKEHESYNSLFYTLGLLLFSGVAPSKDPGFQLFSIRAGRVWINRAKKLAHSEVFDPVLLERAFESLNNICQTAFSLPISSEFQQLLYLSAFFEGNFLLGVMRYNSNCRKSFSEEKALRYLQSAFAQCANIWDSALQHLPGEVVSFRYDSFNMILRPGERWFECLIGVMNAAQEYIQRNNAVPTPDVIEAQLLIRSGLSLFKKAMRKCTDLREMALLCNGSSEFRTFLDYLIFSNIIALRLPAGNRIKFSLEEIMDISDEFRFIEFVRPRSKKHVVNQGSGMLMQNKNITGEDARSQERKQKPLLQVIVVMAFLLSLGFYLSELYLPGALALISGITMYFVSLATNTTSVKTIKSKPSVDLSAKRINPLERCEYLRSNRKYPGLWVSYYFCIEHGLPGFPPWLHVTWGAASGGVGEKFIEIDTNELPQMINRLSKQLAQIYEEGDGSQICDVAERGLKSLSSVLLPIELVEFLASAQGEFGNKYPILSIIPSQELHHVPFELLGGLNQGCFLGQDFDVRYQPFAKIAEPDAPIPARFSKLSIWPTRKIPNLTLDSFHELIINAPDKLWKALNYNEQSPEELLAWAGSSKLFLGRGDIALCFHGKLEADTGQVRILCDRKGITPEEMIGLLSSTRFEKSLKDRTIWLLSCEGAEGKVAGVDAFEGWAAAFLWGGASTAIMHFYKPDVLRLEEIMTVMAEEKNLLRGAVAYKVDCFARDSWLSRVNAASVRIFQLS